MMNVDGSDQRRYVRLSDRRLAEVAAQAAARIDLGTLLHRRSEATGVMKERSIDGTAVTATCIIDCSVKEIQALLVPPTTDRYASVMRELMGQDFIYGTIVHNANEVTTQSVSVRTVTFAKRHILARNEQLCFVSAVKPLELCSSSKEEKGFTVTLASLHPDDVFTGKAQAACVTHIQGMSALYLVTPEVPRRRKQGRSKRAVRVTFCADVASTPGSNRKSPLRWLKMVTNREEADGASNGVVLARAVQYARTLKQFNVAVRRRRLDAQVFADLQKVQPSNNRCACCTRRVRVKKCRLSGLSERSTEKSTQGPKRCHLCAFLVCARCVCTVGNRAMSMELLERSSKSVKYSRTIYLCEHCMQRVDDADYDSYCASNGSMSPTGAIQPDSPDAETSSSVIARVLSQVLANASNEEKPVVIRVIKYLLGPNKEIKSTYSAASAELIQNLGRLATEQGFAEEINVRNLNSELTPEVPTPTKDQRPILAGSSGRQYALQYTDIKDYQDEDSDETDTSDGTEEYLDSEARQKISYVSRYPVPSDEGARLRWLESHPNIMSRLMNLPDLELLCEIALAEFQCNAVLVTVFGATTCYVVASTDPVWRNVEIPRHQTICGHTLMSGDPLFLKYPEADVRFTAMNLVRHDGLRFYFGFPVQISYPGNDGITTVGTFCCVQTDINRDITESQFALMATLVQGVSRVFEFQASCSLENQFTT
ncbi:putative GAF-like domain superfamily protein [Plasmopara halstedii]